MSRSHDIATISTLTIPSTQTAPLPRVSVIVPVYNAAPYLRTCLLSVLTQTDVPLSSIELIVYDDNSTDESYSVACETAHELASRLNRVLIKSTSSSPFNSPNGCGAARNRACEHARGSVLVFQDADDVMLPGRISRSLSALSVTSSDIVGGTFERIPHGSTPRYEAYHARLRTSDLFVHAFRDAPLAMPTVSCHMSVWRVVPFREGLKVPEDLHFMYDAMKKGFRLCKITPPHVVQYRFHDGMTSLALHRRALLAVRVRAFEHLVLQVLPNWSHGFSIWNAGRDGKEVYNALSEHARKLVRVWGDINPRKIGQRIRNIPVVHYTQLEPPIACCVPLDREGGEFEKNLESLNLEPGYDYIHLV